MKILAIEDAILAAIAGASLGLKTLRTVQAQDFGEDGTLQVTAPRPAVLVMLDNAPGSPATVRGTVHRFDLFWRLFIVTESLRGSDEAQRGAYELIEAIFDLLAGEVLSAEGLKAQFSFAGFELVSATNSQVAFSLNLSCATYFQRSS